LPPIAEFCCTSVAHDLVAVGSVVKEKIMASIHKDPRTDVWQVVFRWEGEQYKRTAHTKKKKDAETLAGRVDDTIKMLRTGHLSLLLTNSENVSSVCRSLLKQSDFKLGNRSPGESSENHFVQNRRLQFGRVCFLMSSK
jgi:hypothetical protein